MSEFLVPDDPRPAPQLGAPTFPATAVRVTPVPGGVRLTFAPTGDGALADEVSAALRRVEERERREGGFLRVTVAVRPDGAAVDLTITGPPGHGAPAAAPRRVLVRDTPPLRP